MLGGHSRLTGRGPVGPHRCRVTSIRVAVGGLNGEGLVGGPASVSRGDGGAVAFPLLVSWPGQEGGR